MNNIENIKKNVNEKQINNNADVIVSVSNLHKTYSKSGNSLHILKGIDIDIMCGEILSVTGESGSGKSTFLNLVGGLDNP